MNEHDKEKLELMADLITDYISKRECEEDFIGNDYDCINCENIHFVTLNLMKISFMEDTIQNKNFVNNFFIKVVV